MAIVIRMPEVLAGALEGVISRWAVSEGDQVAVGDVLCEIETDKASVEYQAEDSGVVARIVQKDGELVDVGNPIAVFSQVGDTEADVEAAVASTGLTEERKPSPEAPVEELRAVSSEAAVEIQPPRSESPRGEGLRIYASPIVRKLASERGIDLTGIPGSGPSGRIVRKDLEEFMVTERVAISPLQGSASSVASTAEFIEIPHSSMRRAIARRLSESKSTVPHFYVTEDCRVDRLLHARAEVNEGLGVKTSVNDWVIKAVGRALMSVPQANVMWTESAMRQFSQADVSVAVATDGGLYTPVVRGVNQLTVVEIGQIVKDLAERARSGSIKQQDIEGGSFAVTNLGMFGTQEFSAILNPPQSGILAVGAAREKAIVIDGQITVGQIMTVTLSADHRAVDGALAAQWMSAFKAAIENPLSLLL